MLRRQLQIAGVHYTSISDDRFEELVSQIESGAALTQEDILKQTNQERQTLKEVEARKISELEKNVKELHDMFHEMTVLLNDESQDENDFIADNIEHNVENTKDYIPKATKDYVPEVTEPIEIARNYPKKTSVRPHLAINHSHPLSSPSIVKMDDVWNRYNSDSYISPNYNPAYCPILLLALALVDIKRLKTIEY
uniref:Uncharacterized protein n=1 Tax=Amphimedon queenslandica TaxID=400682 RepID=A0A1X7TD32_AMPQE